MPKPPHLLCCSPLAQLAQPRGMADCPKHSRNRPHGWYKIHLLSSQTPGSVWSWQGQGRGSSASFLCHLPNSATYSLTSHPPAPKVLLLQFQRIMFAKLSCYPEKETQNISDTSFNFIRKCPFDFSGIGTFKNDEFQRHDNNQILKNTIQTSNQRKKLSVNR